MTSITDESHISEDTRSSSNSESGEYQSTTRINHEASTSSCEAFCRKFSSYLASTISQILQPTIINRRRPSKDAKTYQLDKFTTNLMLVFNMYKIPEEDNRDGTEEDVKALKSCFKPRGFEVVVYNNYTKDEIIDVFERLILRDLSDFGCLAVVFLTHGRDDGILLTTSGKLQEGDIIKYLTISKMPSLINKPKILIFQACRGTVRGCYGTMKVSEAATVTGEVQGTRDTNSINCDHKFDNPYGMASETDFLRLHSTYPGRDSHRDKYSGSWFIQPLCKFICMSNPDDDVLTIITRVIHNVSITKKHNNGKQVPIMTSTLSKKLCFNTKRVKSDSAEPERSDDVDSSIAPIDVTLIPLSGYLTFAMKKIIALSHNVWLWALSIRSPWRQV